MARRTRAGPAATVPLARIEPIDALRGLAIVAMVAYHFAFDLRFFGVTRSDFENDPFWLTARACIVSAFLLLVGISVVLAIRNGMPQARFVRRVATIGACAMAVSVASYVVFPQTFIYFGILHCIAVSMLVARPLATHSRIALLAGIAIVATGLAVSHPAFDNRLGSIVGFTTQKPPTQDYVPLFPWLGVVLIGVALGDALVRLAFGPIAALGALPGSLRWMGRHSLAIYMLHQPLLLGSLWLVLAIARPGAWAI
jgi:uncharacterized membrane protein